MDRQRQKFSETLMQYFLLASAVVAFLVGYFYSSFWMMFYIYTIGVFITFVVTIPDWSFFNRHPLEWLELKYVDIPSSRQLKLRQQQAAKKSSQSQEKRSSS